LSTSSYYASQNLEHYKHEFVIDLLHFEKTFREYAHDLDQMKTKGGRVVAKLIVLLHKSGHPDPYRDCPLNLKINRPDRELISEVMDGVVKILTELKRQVEPDREEDVLLNISGHAQSMIDALISLCKLKDFKELYQVHLETLFFGQNLEKQREESMQRQDYLKHDLQVNSIYPLYLKPNYNLFIFISSHGVEFDPTAHYTLTELVDKVRQVVTIQKDIHAFSTSDIQNSLVQHLGCRPAEITLTNDVTFFQAVLRNTVCPHYIDLFYLNYPEKVGYLITEAELIKHRLAGTEEALHQRAKEGTAYTTPVKRSNLVKIPDKTHTPVATKATGCPKRGIRNYLKQKKLTTIPEEASPIVSTTWCTPINWTALKDSTNTPISSTSSKPSTQRIKINKLIELMDEEIELINTQGDTGKEN